MKRIILGTLVGGALLLGSVTAASADVSTNPTTNDAYGYCMTNHLKNFNAYEHGVGHLRARTRGTVAELAGNRAPDICFSSQGAFPPISNSN